MTETEKIVADFFKRYIGCNKQQCPNCGKSYGRIKSKYSIALVCECGKQLNISKGKVA